MSEKKRDALASSLRKEIMSGRYGPEGGLPEEKELVQATGYARGTVRAALFLLEGEKLIVQRGRTYYVNSLPITMTSYVPPASVRHSGKQSYVENLDDVKGNHLLPRYLAEKIGVPHSTPTVFCTRLAGELVDGEQRPTQLSYRYYFLPLSEEQVQRMQNDPGYDPAWDTSEALESYDEVIARPGTHSELQALGLPESTTVVGLLEVIRNQSGNLVMVHESTLTPRVALIFAFEFLNKPGKSA